MGREGSRCTGTSFFVLNSQGLAFTRRDHVLVVGEPERLEPYIEMEARDYSGDIISIDFQGDDFDEVMRFFSDAADREIVADARFTGALHFKLTDVPWDQALDVVLALYGLGFEAGDSAIRIVSSLWRRSLDRAPCSPSESASCAHSLSPPSQNRCTTHKARARGYKSCVGLESCRDPQTSKKKTTKNANG
jgi:hypothetical protein